MFKKKYIIIAVGIVSILLGSLFINNAILAQTGDSEYDPWLDYNEDGTVDASDLFDLSKAYSTSGDPTKNVNVSSHASQLIKVAVDVLVYADSYWASDYISIDGSSKVTFLITIQCDPLDNTVWIFATDASHTRRFLVEWPQDVGGILNNYVKTFDVMNQEIRIEVTNHSASNATLNIQIYLVA